MSSESCTTNCIPLTASPSDHFLDQCSILQDLRLYLGDTICNPSKHASNTRLFLYRVGFSYFKQNFAFGGKHRHLGASARSYSMFCFRISLLPVSWYRYCFPCFLRTSQSPGEKRAWWFTTFAAVAKIRTKLLYNNISGCPYFPITFTCTTPLPLPRIHTVVCRDCAAFSVGIPRYKTKNDKKIDSVAVNHSPFTIFLVIVANLGR